VLGPNGRPPAVEDPVAAAAAAGAEVIDGAVTVMEYSAGAYTRPLFGST